MAARKGASAAVAAVAAVAWIAFYVVRAESAGPSFDDVVRRHTPDYLPMRYDAEYGPGASMRRSRHVYTRDGNTRLENVDRGVSIVNVTANKHLEIDHVKRTATFGLMRSNWKQRPWQVQLLRVSDLSGDAQEIAATRVIDGVTCWGWRTLYNDQQTEIWADDEARIHEMWVPSPPARWSIRYTRIEYDPQVDAAEFSVAIPSGYEVRALEPPRERQPAADAATPD